MIHSDSRRYASTLWWRESTECSRMTPRCFACWCSLNQYLSGYHRRISWRNGSRFPRYPCSRRRFRDLAASCVPFLASSRTLYRSSIDFFRSRLSRYDTYTIPASCSCGRTGARDIFISPYWSYAQGSYGESGWFAFFLMERELSGMQWEELYPISMTRDTAGKGHSGNIQWTLWSDNARITFRTYYFWFRNEK